MDNFWQKLEKPIIGLAPMAGFTDSAFRRICKRNGAELLYSEMVSSHGLFYQDKKSFSLCQFRKEEQPLIIQIFGREPEIMASAGQIIEDKIKADGIDINFGCPARRVVRSGHGVALMDEPKLAEKIAKSVVKAVKIPVSIKCRLGASKKDEIFDFASRMESAGIKALALHGRTLKQGFTGAADWEPIYKLASKSKILILGNGDIKNQNDIALKLIENQKQEAGSKIAGILIGRGALGNPFIFGEVGAIKKEPKRFIGRRGFVIPRISRRELYRTIIEQAELSLAEKGERGLIEMRKHLCFYVKGLPRAKQLRRKLVRIKNVDEIKNILESGIKN